MIAVLTIQRAFAALALVALASPALAEDASAGFDACTSQPVELVADAAAPVSVGPLMFAGGVEILPTREGREVSGISGLAAAPGDVLEAVTDFGGFLMLVPSFDAAGRLSGVVCRASRLQDSRGRTLSGKAQGDSEGLARLSDDLLAVSFERNHRIELLRPDARGVWGLTPGPELGQTGRLQNNSGLEAIGVLGSGALVAGVERMGEDGAHKVWRFAPTGDPARPFADAEGPAFRLAAEPGYGLVGFEGLGDAGLLVLYRAWDPVRGNRNILAHVPAAEADTASGVVTPRRIALFTPANGHVLDNFEGVAARMGEGGAVEIWIVADSNASDRQRTLLYRFVGRLD